MVPLRLSGTRRFQPVILTCDNGRTRAESRLDTLYFASSIQMLPVVSAYSYTMDLPSGAQSG